MCVGSRPRMLAASSASFPPLPESAGRATTPGESEVDPVLESGRSQGTPEWIMRILSRGIGGEKCSCTAIEFATTNFDNHRSTR